MGQKLQEDVKATLKAFIYDGNELFKPTESKLRFPVLLSICISCRCA